MYLIEKLENGKYQVSNSLGHVFAKGTTLKRAESQVRFLHMVVKIREPNWWKSYKAR